MKNTKNTNLVGFEPMSNAETAKVVGGIKKPGEKKDKPGNTPPPPPCFPRQ